MGRKWGAFIFVFGLLALAGCGDDSPDLIDTGNDAVALTAWLPADRPVFGFADVAQIKEALDVPADADPLSLSPWASGALDGLWGSHPDKSTVAALDLGDIEQVAATGGTKDVDAVTVMRTSADPDEIKGALLDLGFVDHDRILESPDGQGAHGALAVRIEGDVILLSPDAATLAAIPDEPRGLPLEVLSRLGGDEGYGYEVDKPCEYQFGLTTSTDGSGEMVSIVEGGGDPEGMVPEPDSAKGIGEPVVDGDTITVDLDLPQPMSAREFQSAEFASYLCD